MDRRRTINWTVYSGCDSIICSQFPWSALDEGTLQVAKLKSEEGSERREVRGRRVKHDVNKCGVLSCAHLTLIQAAACKHTLLDHRH